MINGRLEHGLVEDRTQSNIANGVSVIRRLAGPLSELYEQFEPLEEYYPELDVRKPGDTSRRAPALQQLGAREVAVNRNKIGYVAAQTALDALLERVPSLSREQHIRLAWVDTNVDRRTDATFVSLVPHAKDVLRLARERHAILTVIDDLAEKDGLYWQPNMPRITAAYVPSAATPAALIDTVKVFESSLSPSSPLEVTLLPPPDRLER